VGRVRLLRMVWLAFFVKKVSTLGLSRASTFLAPTALGQRTFTVPRPTIVGSRLVGSGSWTSLLGSTVGDSPRSTLCPQSMRTIIDSGEGRMLFDACGGSGRKTTIHSVESYASGRSMTEIYMMAGVPGSGKSTEVKKLPPHVYLSRDKEGGKVLSLLPKMHKAIADGAEIIVLDCTFLLPEHREPFLQAAEKAQVPVHLKFLDVSKEQAQFNLCWRMCERYGHVLRSEEMDEYKHDPNMFPPTVLFGWFKKMVRPQYAEGFDSVEVIKIGRWPLPSEFKNKAFIVDYDGTVRETKSGEIYPTDPSDVRALPQAAEKLQKIAKEGRLLLGASNQSGVAKGLLTMETARACFEEANRQLGVDIEYAFDYSRSGPITSWHRKPMPGIGVDFIWKHRLDPSQCVFVGDMTSDETFAQRCGFQFEWAKDFFGHE